MQNDSPLISSGKQNNLQKLTTITYQSHLRDEYIIQLWMKGFANLLSQTEENTLYDNMTPADPAV